MASVIVCSRVVNKGPSTNISHEHMYSIAMSAGVLECIRSAYRAEHKVTELGACTGLIFFGKFVIIENSLESTESALRIECGALATATSCGAGTAGVGGGSGGGIVVPVGVGRAAVEIVVRKEMLSLVLGLA